MGFSWNQYQSTRAITALNKSAKAKYNGQTYVAKIRSGANYHFANDVIISPQASLNYVYNKTDNYAETNADSLGLNVRGNSSDFLEARAGLGISRKFIVRKVAEITPRIVVSYGYNFLSAAQTTTSNFIGQATTFNTVSAKLDPESLKLETGLDFYNTNDFTLSADYIVEQKRKFRSHSGLLKGKLDF